MILKPLELQNHLDKKIYLFYGENSGQKELIEKFFKNKHLESIYNYTEKEIFLIRIIFIIKLIHNPFSKKKINNH